MPRFAHRPRPACQRLILDEARPGYVAFTRGNGTYNARARLKALGGYWNPELAGGVWLVPEKRADEAEANIRLAERTGEELPLDGGPDIAKITCYCCGARHLPSQFAALRFAVPADWYCGCTRRDEEPVVKPRHATTRSRYTRPSVDWDDSDLPF